MQQGGTGWLKNIGLCLVLRETKFRWFLSSSKNKSFCTLLLFEMYGLKCTTSRDYNDQYTVVFGAQCVAEYIMSTPTACVFAHECACVKVHV